MRLPGVVPREQNASRLALGDIAAGPKLSATEGAGKLLNYMSIGLPTVAFDTPVSREYLADATSVALAPALRHNTPPRPGRISTSRRCRP